MKFAQNTFEYEVIGDSLLVGLHRISITVLSEDGKEHFVSYNKDKKLWICNCAAKTNYFQDRDCRHIKLVKQFLIEGFPGLQLMMWGFSTRMDYNVDKRIID